jgi:hypothetical protein
VLRPGGRVALAVWGPPERNPWLALVFATVAAELRRPVPPPGVPGPFSLADGERLGALLSRAGLADVRVGELRARRRGARRACAGGDARRPHAGGLEFPGLSLVAAARRA